MPTITNPLQGDVHVNRPFTDFSQKYMQNEASFVATRAFPSKPVTNQSDSYYTFSRADWYRDEVTERADGAESDGGGFSLSTDTYSAKVYAWHKDVTDRQRQNADPAINLDNSAAQYVMHKLLIGRERKFVNTFMTTSVWDTDVAGTASTPSAGSTFRFWDNASSDAVKDIRYGSEVVQGTTGFKPNKLLIGRSAYNALLDNAGVLDRINGGATTGQPAQVQKMLLAQLFELDEIFVVDAVYNSSVRGKAESTGFIAGDKALLYYAPNSVGLETPSAATIFNWTAPYGSTAGGIRVKRFRMEANEADRIEGQMSFDHKVTGSELGYFFNNCVT